jgi:hypothetical protein
MEARNIKRCVVFEVVSIDIFGLDDDGLSTDVLEIFREVERMRVRPDQWQRALVACECPKKVRWIEAIELA